MALRIVEQAGHTDVGRQRTANEDSLFVSPPMFAVADGMGGAKAGEVASAVAVEAWGPRESRASPPRRSSRASSAMPTGGSTSSPWRTSRAAAWARRSRWRRCTETT